ncbi:MAG: CopG family antitoxin [Elusimicrobiales bacterium]
MKRFKLTKSEKAIENAFLRGEYVPVSAAEHQRVVDAIAAYRKDAVISLRINSQDLRHIKEKARKFGVPYQRYITEILHRFAAQ